MENKSGSGAKAGSLGGKGFYIVLFLCAAVIGMSAWIMLTDAGTNVEEQQAEQPVIDVSGIYPTMIPTEQQLPEDNADAMAPEGAAVDENAPQEAEEGASDQEETSQQEEPQAQSVFSETVTEYVWPVKGTIQTPYSIQTLLYDSTMADWRTHDGIDVSSELGSPVLAAAGGLVVDVRSDDMLGTVVEIDHENGVHSVYANLADQPPVVPGQAVSMGEVIGSVGGTALGEVNQVSHLHFAMTCDGASADPMAYLPSELAE